MKPSEIVSVADDPEAFDAWRRGGEFPGIDDGAIYGAFGRSYYPAVFEDRREDVGFAVTSDDDPQLIVACTRGADEIDYYGAPVRFFPREGLTGRELELVIAAAFDHLDQLADEGQHVSVCDDGAVGELSALGKQCLNRRASAALRLTGYCALDGGEVGMRAGLRKSFQSLINWGRRNLDLVSIGKPNPDAALFKAYQAFHAVVAGRVTRSDKSWDAMFDWIAAGRGELVLGYLKSGELVTGTMVVDGAVCAFYASGVYDRERFHQPLAHWPLWVAMLHSAERGKQVFELGDLPLPGAGSDKEFAIGYFKRGFATKIGTSIVWNWRRAPSR